MSDIKVAVLDNQAVKDFVSAKWENEITPKLQEYIKIPNISPLYDAEIHTNGHQEKVVELMVDWAKEQKVENFDLKVLHEKGRTPLIFGVVEGEGKTDETILMYGHFDKQPPMTESWEEGLGPWSPVIRDGKLFGRGGADDGYALFASITAVKALQEQKVPFARVVIMIEGSEESGSMDLPFYVDKLKDEIGSNVSLVVCLDSGCGNYEQMWLTSSLRGLVAGNLNIKLLTEGVHSGAASGIVPSTFRILRQLLARIEDTETGEVIVPEAKVEIPQDHIGFATKTAEILGDSIHLDYAWVKGAKPVSYDLTTLVLNNTWKATLCITGIEGLPDLKNAGNVLRTDTNVKLSIRLPPSLSPVVMNAALKRILETDAPYGAQVEWEPEKGAQGWVAPDLAPWLTDSVERASQTFFEKPSCGFGEGGTIPLMGMLSKLFPSTQFVITGVLGPKSNAHGPNESLDLAMGTRLTMCISQIIGDHYLNTAK